MVSRENEIVLVCAILGTGLATAVADLEAGTVATTAVLVYVGAIVPMLINNYRERD